jgi:hypothetical protein
MLFLVLRKVNEENKRDYDKNTEFRQFMRRYMALSTLPAHQMLACYTQLKQEAQHQPPRIKKRLNKLHTDYFEKHWFRTVFYFLTI